MDATYQTKRIADMAGAMRLARELIGHDHWSADELAAFQRRRLGEVVRHAVASSRFYRERYAGLDLGDLLIHQGITPVELEGLPNLLGGYIPAYNNLMTAYSTIAKN